MHTDMQRRAFLAFALLCLGGRRAFATQTTDDLTGIWSAQVRTKGGLGAQMTFTAAGDITSTFGALVDFKYEIDGSRLKLTSLNPNDPQPPTPVIQDFTIDGDTLRVVTGGGAAQVMTRVGAPYGDAHPIIGDWTFTHSTGQPAWTRYARSGITQLTIPFQTIKGTYRVADGMLHIQFDGKPPLALTIKRDGDVLTTTDRNGKDIRFVKFNY
jgi:hypothetical protein